MTSDFLRTTHYYNSKMAAHINEAVFRESKQIERITEPGDFFHFLNMFIRESIHYYLKRLNRFVVVSLMNELYVFSH